jgi:glycosyltransferase involved in cell wall biosynthesis
MKKVLIISICDFPWNRGVDRAVRAFLEKGHEVCIAAENRNGLPVKDKYLGRVDIYRLPGFKNRVISRIVNNNFPFNPFWGVFIIRLLRKLKPDVIIVREIHLVLAAAFSRLFYKAPIFLDMREAYPYVMEVRRKTNLLDILTRNIFLTKLLEYFSVSLSDFIYVVIESQVKRISENYGYPIERIGIVPNTISKEFHEKAQKYFKLRIENIRRKKDEPFTPNFVYTGFISQHRNIEPFIDAVKSALQKGINMQLTIIGEGNKACIDNVKKQISGVDEIIFRGFVSPEDVVSELSQFDYGIITYKLTRHTNHTMPGKFCEYISIGLPFVSTAIDEIVKLNEGYDCGYFISDGEDKNDILNVLMQVHAKGWDGLEKQSKEARRLYLEKMSYLEAIKGYNVPLESI